VIVGQACLGGQSIVLAVMDFAFLGGSMGLEVGRRISGAAEAALEARTPLVVVCASGGARMQEGVFSLLQMARTAQAFARLHEAGVLSVCVLTDPTYGGVSASFANLGAVVVAERGAHVGFAGPRVVQETIRAELPEGFQTAEFLLEHGLVDRVESRGDLRPLLIRLLAVHNGGNNDSRETVAEPEVMAPAGDRLSRDPWETVRTARNIDRPTALEYLSYAFDDFVELHGDRAYSDDPAVVGGMARIADRSVVVLGHQKGHTLGDLVARNFGMPHPEGYRKAIRLMQYAETFGFPVVALVDTPGAYPGPDAEQRGQSIAIADAIRRSTRLRVPVVSVITGEGGSGGALALSTSDRLLVLENAFLSVISPEGCAAILWRTASSAPAAARALQLGARHLLDSGIATSVIAEPEGGAQADPIACASRLRAALLRELDELSQLTPAELLDLRHQRFSRLGTADPIPAAPKHDVRRRD
jgi:acetyl-CoA carboxylase carboxyl transferase subunit beta